MAPKAGHNSRSSQITKINERRQCRTLVLDTVAEIEAYIKMQRQTSLGFRFCTAELRVEYTKTPRSQSALAYPIRLIQPGVRDVHLAIRKQSLTPTLVAEKEQDSRSTSKVDGEVEWLPLREWLSRHYDAGSYLEDFLQDQSLYNTTISYLRDRCRTDFDFWTKAANVRVSKGQLYETFWYCSFELPTNSSSPSSIAVLIRQKPKSKTRSTPAQVFDLEIGMPGCWMPFLTWIGIHLESLIPATGTMNDWWEYNGKAFRLLDLPEELRFIVYAQAIGPYIQPVLLHDLDSQNHYAIDPGHQQLEIWRPNPRTKTDRFGRQPRRPCTYTVNINKLARVNKQIHFEVMKATWEETTVYSDTFFDPARLAFWPHVFKPYNALRRIELNLPAREYFRFLDLQTVYQCGFLDWGQDMTPPVGILTEIPTLQHLHFRFRTRPPKRQPWNGPPGGSSWLSADPWLKVSNAWGTEVVSCQAVFVDWFFTLAWEDLRCIPRVTFSGHVKNSTRAKWEARFGARKADKQYDLSADIARIQATSWQNLPPVCKCKTPCNWWNVHGPYLEGEDPYFQPGAISPYSLHFSPDEFDRFDCED